MVWSPTWTPDEVALLRLLWSQGLTVNVIAERLGKSRNAVIGKAHRLKLDGRPSPIRRAGEAHPEPQQPVYVPPVHTLPPLPSEVLLPLFAAAPPVHKPAPRPEPVRPTAEVILFRPLNCRCAWLDGDSPKSYRQCEASAVYSDELRGPWSYCSEHRQRAYLAVRPRDIRVPA